MKILIVDDDPMIVELFEMDLKLNYQDCLIFTAENGEDALNLCKETDFDLVFTDGKMPKMDGIELSTTLKEMNYGAVIVLVTGYHKLLDEDNSGQFGITKVLRKPVNFEEMHECIDTIRANLNTPQ